MSKIKSGDRVRVVVRVVHDLYPEDSPVDDMVGLEGTAIDAAPVWVRVDFGGSFEMFHPSELEVIKS